jgi:Tol biopolymer transport system component/DNA-binding winged helix-turn-helix (wHTH) protein
MTKRNRQFYEFGPFRLDASKRLLFRQNQVIALTPKVLHTLLVLLENSGRVVSKDELMKAVWPDTFVEEGNLTQNISVLRKVLGEHAGEHSYIITVPKQGYRFIVECALADAAPHTSPSSRNSGFLPKAVTALFAIAAIGAAIVFLPRSHVPAARVRPVPLTSFRGIEANPALSPDGRYVAFTWNGEKLDNFDIYVTEINSSAVTRLTVHPAEDTSPAWSPDGRTIAFLRRVGKEDSNLVLVAATGGPEHTVAQIREKPWFAPQKPTGIAWSPDGRWIAVSHRQPEDVSEGIYLFSSTGEKRRLTTPSGARGDHFPSFSPDGRAVAFCRLPGGFVTEIYVLPLGEGLQPLGPARRLTDHKRWSGQPVWTPDGRSIVYVFGEHAGRRREIRRINVADRQESTEAVPVNDQVSEISIGRHLIYSSRFEDTNIWRAKLPRDGDPPVNAEPFIASTHEDQTPSFSPDGKRIAFVSGRSGSREVWVSNADGSNATRMTSFGGPMVGNPKWSPDEQWIVFHARPNGPTDLFAIPSGGGRTEQLTSNSTEDSYPIYSQDGKAIFFSSRRSGEMQIWKMALDTRDAVRISTAEKAHVLEMSPDGTTIFYHLQQDPGEIRSVPAGGGESSRVVGPTQLYPSGFTVTAKGIYYGAPPHAGETRFIYFFSFATGRSAPVVLANHPFHTGMTVSPDGRYILFDQYDETTSDLMLVENFVLP